MGEVGIFEGAELDEPTRLIADLFGVFEKTRSMIWFSIFSILLL